MKSVLQIVPGDKATYPAAGQLLTPTSWQASLEVQQANRFWRNGDANPSGNESTKVVYPGLSLLASEGALGGCGILQHDTVHRPTFGDELVTSFLFLRRKEMRLVKKSEDRGLFSG